MPAGRSFVNFAASCGCDEIFSAIGFSVVVDGVVPEPAVVDVVVPDVVPDVVVLVPAFACFPLDVDFVVEAVVVA
jgi:hypothetical protein